MELFQCADNDKVIYRTAELRSWSKRPYECNHCPFNCDSNTELNNHIKSVHDIKKSYSCSFCARNFSRKENLKRHIKSLHTHCAKSRLLKIFSIQHLVLQPWKKIFLPLLRKPYQVVHLALVKAKYFSV